MAVTFIKSGGYNVEGIDSTQLTESQRIIYDAIKNYTQVTAKEMADTLAVTLSLSKRTVEREISFLRNNGFIRKEGKKNKGFWVVLK